MSVLFWALAVVLIVEGLALALAPLRVEDALRLLARLGREQRRMIGLIAIALGALVLYAVQLVA